MNTIITIIIVVIISLGVYFLIKKVCQPIKTPTAILLVIPTVATCEIALLIYKFFKNTIEVTSYKEKSSTNSSITFQVPLYNDSVSKKEKKKKVTRSFTDSSGKTAYYDEEGNLVASSINNGFGQKNFTDGTGNYAATSISNNLGTTIYTDRDGNVTLVPLIIKATKHLLMEQ